MIQDVVVPEIPKMPVSGRDYPRTWDQFLDWFPNDVACAAYLEGLRWANGFVCPQCAVSDEAYRSSRGRLVCRHCRHHCTVTAGTIFEKTRTPLRSWLAAVWYITNQKQGVNALGLQRVLGLGSYQTAWTMLHRLRRAMIRPGRERLSGIVEVDESIVGRSVAKSSRDPEKAAASNVKILANRSVVVMAVELNEPSGFGRIRLQRVPDMSATSVLPFIEGCVEPGSIIRTDGSWAYHKLQEHGYRRDKRVILGATKPAHVTMPGVHRVASLLKRWLMGTHQGSVKPKQLDFYLDEFTFRFNRRTSRSRGLLFYRLLQQAVETGPMTYDQITAASDKVY